MEDYPYPMTVGANNPYPTEKSIHDPRLPMRKRVELQKQQLQERLKHIEQLEKVLDENPGIEEFQNLMNRLGGI